jgi:hypothetical protein
MQINLIAAKVMQVPVELLILFFRDHHIVIPRHIRYKILKTLVNEEKENEASELWNYYPKEYLAGCEAFSELELEQVLFSLHQEGLLSKFQRHFWQEVISNQFMMGVTDKFFNELGLLASNNASTHSFREYYEALNSIIEDTNGQYDGLVFQNLIKRIKNTFTYYQVISFIIKYQIAKEDNVYNHILAKQILKTVELTDLEFSLKKSVLFSISSEMLSEIAQSLNIDLSEESKDQYAREFLAESLEHKDEIVSEEALSDEEIVRIVNKFIPLGQEAKEKLALDEKKQYMSDFKKHLESEASLMSSLINYNKDTNKALEMLKHELTEMENKNKELSEKVIILSKATGVAFAKHYQLKKALNIALKVLAALFFLFIGLFVFWYLYTHNFKDFFDNLFGSFLTFLSWFDSKNCIKII